MILGFTFKGDCPDVRNTKIIDVYKELCSYNMNVDVHDHWASKTEVKKNYGINLLNKLDHDKYDAIVIAVDHSDYKSWGEEKIRSFGKDHHIVYDLKYVLPLKSTEKRL